MDSQLYMDMIKRITKLENDLRHLQAQKKLYEIFNEDFVTLSADETSWDIPNADFIDVALNANVNIHGIQNGTPGRFLFVYNSTLAMTLTLVHNSGSAAVGEKIGIPTATNLSLSAGYGAWLVYHYTLATSTYVWRVLLKS